MIFFVCLANMAEGTKLHSNYRDQDKSFEHVDLMILLSFIQCYSSKCCILFCLLKIRSRFSIICFESLRNDLRYHLRWLIQVLNNLSQISQNKRIIRVSFIIFYISIFSRLIVLTESLQD